MTAAGLRQPLQGVGREQASEAGPGSPSLWVTTAQFFGGSAHASALSARPWPAAQASGPSRMRSRTQSGPGTSAMGLRPHPPAPPLHGSSRTNGGRPLRLCTSTNRACSNARMARERSSAEKPQPVRTRNGGLTKGSRLASALNRSARSIKGAFACPERTAAPIQSRASGPFTNRVACRVQCRRSSANPTFRTGIAASGTSARGSGRD
jgi:hypothetical protein